jgi:hypothetical protein
MNISHPPYILPSPCTRAQIVAEVSVQAGMNETVIQQLVVALQLHLQSGIEHSLLATIEHSKIQ